MDFPPPAVSLFSLQSDAEPPWPTAGESLAPMPAPVQTRKELGILPEGGMEHKGMRGGPYGRIRWAGLGAAMSWGTPGVSPWVSWGPPSSGDLRRVLGPLGWSCPPSELRAEVFPTSHVTSIPPGTVGDSGWPSRQRAFGDEMTLEQLYTSVAGHTTSPYQGHALPAGFLPANELLQEKRDDLTLIDPCCRVPEPAWIQGGGTLTPIPHVPCPSLATLLLRGPRC